MTKRPGVAILVHNVDLTGGMERQALRLAHELARLGHRVSLVSSVLVAGVWPRLPRGTPFRERRGRLTLYRVPLPRGWFWTHAVELFELAATAILATRAPGLGALYAVQWTSGLHAERAARVLELPFFVKFAGGGRNGDFAEMARQQATSTALVGLERAAGLVCISPEIESEALAAGLSSERVARIPNGVDLARIESAPRAQLPGPDDSERVLFVGALRREKRIPDLVRAFEPVARARPRARLVIAGDGPEEPAIREAARALGLESRVDLLGRRSDVPSLLRAAHAFVLTSESEGLSNALLEAMAAGAPIVATDIAGNSAVVAHEREALLVPLGDQAALGRALERLLEDRELATRLSSAAREKVQRYSIERVARDYASLFAREARPLASSLVLAGRWLTRLGGLGVSGLVVAVSSQQFEERGRARVSSVVVALKRALGIEGELL